MISDPEWAQAENALLATECTMTRDEYSLRYESKQDTRRLNGVRIVDIDALDQAGWGAVLARHSDAFAAREMPLSIQLAEPMTGEQLPGQWQPVGVCYDHVATDIADFSGESQRAVRLEPVTSDDQVHAFAEMMMVDRIPDFMHQRARPSIHALWRRLMPNPEVAMLLAYDGDDMVGQLALIQATGDQCNGYTVSTLSVARPFRGRGYMKAVYAAITSSFQGNLYGQIITGKPTMAYRQRFASTRVLATVHNYQRADDPHGGRW